MDRLAELLAGRLFVHAVLSDPVTAGLLFGRVLGWDARSVTYELIHRDPDGAERVTAPWQEPVGSFFGSTLGRWHDGPLPAPERPPPTGYEPPMSPRKPGGSGPGRS
jgi:hypothetical protein